MTKVLTTISSARLKRIFHGDVTLRHGLLSEVKKEDIPHIVHAKDVSVPRHELSTTLNKDTLGRILTGQVEIAAGKLSVYKKGDPIVYVRDVSQARKS